METQSPTSLRLLPGLAITVAAVSVFSAYTILQLHNLSRLQTEIIDRNRADSLLLLRIQNDLNSLGSAMRDMVDSAEPYPLTAWQHQFRRIRTDLEDAMAREATVSPASRTPDQARYLAASMSQFWDALERVFTLAESNEAEARTHIRLSLQARHEALTSTIARLLVQNHEQEQTAAAETQATYTRVERNVYVFLAAILCVIGVTSVGLFRHNRRVFQQVTSLSERRSELARQLIAAQENTMRAVSRELHDDFSQTLTAVGLVLQRAQRNFENVGVGLRRDLHDVHEAIQAMLDRMRSLSHALHPVILDEMGLEGALENYIPAFERRTGIAVRFVRSGQSREVNRELAAHLYRVFQEALSNAGRHSGATRVDVRLSLVHSTVLLEVEDDGAGFSDRNALGMGLVSMRERAELVRGGVEFLSGGRGGALIRFTAPLETEAAHALATL